MSATCRTYNIHSNLGKWLCVQGIPATKILVFVLLVFKAKCLLFHIQKSMLSLKKILKKPTHKKPTKQKKQWKLIGFFLKKQKQYRHHKGLNISSLVKSAFVWGLSRSNPNSQSEILWFLHKLDQALGCFFYKTRVTKMNSCNGSLKLHLYPVIPA